MCRFTGKAIVNYTLSLTDDLKYALPARYVFSNFTVEGTSCEDFMSWGSRRADAAAEMCAKFGWTKTSGANWKSLITWTEAALKRNKSDEFSELLGANILDWTELDLILYSNASSNMLSTVQSANQDISKHYNCTKP
jgi:hypothetical protein